MPELFVFRKQAVEAAQHAGHKSFRTALHENSGMWKFWYEPGEDIAASWQSRDFVHHTEVTWVDKHKVGVLVVSCRKDEISIAEWAQIEAAGLLVEPLTPSLWSKDDKPDATPSRTSSTGAPRAKSDVASPTKLVWDIADSMPGAERKAVIAACVAQGVHPSTASTQFYRWQKAKNV